MWSPIKPCLQAASNDPARSAGVQRVAPPRPTPPGPASSPASWTTRGKDHPTAHLSGPGAGKVWHCVQERGPSAEKTCARGCESRCSIPFPGQQEHHRWACSTGATSVPGACHIVTQARDAPGEVRRRVQQDTTGHRGRKGDPLYHIRILLHSSRDRLTPRQQE